MRLTDYLSEVSLLTDQDSDKDEDIPKVTLMTVHSAKGLEFKNVFVVGMEEGLFPSLLSSDSYRALEEERRLFYVAITRAEEHCYLSYAKNRFRYGKMEFCNPSRFLKDIDACYLDMPQEDVFVRRVEDKAERFRNNFCKEQTPFLSGEDIRSEEPRRFVKPAPPRVMRKIVPVASASSVGAAPVSVGQLIEHERFGRGEIMRVEGAGDNCKATVRFEHAGDKQLLLKFARFKIIDNS